MFEDVAKIERMSYEEYHRVLYYFKHPEAYEGDYREFQRKVIDYSTRINEKGELWRIK